MTSAVWTDGIRILEARGQIPHTAIAPPKSERVSGPLTKFAIVNRVRDR